MRRGLSTIPSGDFDFVFFIPLTMEELFFILVKVMAYVVMISQRINNSNNDREEWVHPINVSRKQFGVITMLFPRLRNDEVNFAATYETRDTYDK